MGFFGNKEITYCDICGEDVKGNEGKLKAKDGLICRVCYRKSGLNRMFGNLSNDDLEFIKSSIDDNEKKYGFYRNSLDINKAAAVTELIDGIPNINQFSNVELILADKRFVIMSPSENKEAKISVDKIKSAKIVTEREVIEHEKNVIGRAVVGGVLFGGLGAVVGAISGTGTKKESNDSTYLLINYESSSGEIKAMSFKANGNSCVGIENFILMLNKQIKGVTLEQESIEL